MTVVLTVGQVRALRTLFVQCDDRQITMFETDDGYLKVDPQVVRNGEDADEREFYLTKGGKVLTSIDYELLQEKDAKASDVKPSEPATPPSGDQTPPDTGGTSAPDVTEE